ncbi:uncharacterized protein LOC120147807 [Hibiscus syriacus]|uniref:uncharacterized protein LOC120147807 n=1 Tax=Hibiscus syriacus TaxID=106335 RepID=UPI001921E8DE|nr:uncharacterized protein LOC120147807 [Hibiscus syriacus]
MKVYLRFLGLWRVVETDEDPPELRPNPTLAQLRAHDEEMLKNDRALTCIYFGLAYHIFTSIMDLETPKSVWNKLKEAYEGGDKVKKIKFSMLQMKEDELIKDKTMRLTDIVNQIRLYGKDLLNEKVVEKVMVSVPQRFEAKFSTIEESCDMSRLTIVDLVNNLGKKPRGLKGKFFGYSTSGQSGKFPPCPVSKKINHAEKDCRFKDRSKTKFQCSFCDKLGHTEKFCWTKKKQAKKQSQQQENASEVN